MKTTGHEKLNYEQLLEQNKSLLVIIHRKKKFFEGHMGGTAS